MTAPAEAPCPSENVLLELASGSLDPSQASGLHEHLDRCAACLRAVAELLRTEKAEGSMYPARYRVIEENARGGQARVLRCVDTVTRRQVALKELLASSDESPEGRRRDERARLRFVREARLTAMLTHPGIVPVYDIGRREDGHPFYTMQFVRGKTLAQALRACRSPGERLRFLGAFGEVCQAVAFAHSRGVVHRDIKPHNVVLGEYGQTMLVDWGLAKLTAGAPDPELDAPLDEAPPAGPEATVAGTVIGTPAYMSPEQASGRLEEIDERSDVFGLGAVLYELLTGKPPLAGSRVTELLAAARERRILPVTALWPDAPRELATIAHKAIAIDRSARYERAADLAADIEAFLTGGRVAAYGYSSWELLRRLVLRHKRTSVSALAALAALVAALAALSVALRRADRERDRAAASGAEALVEGAQAALAAVELVPARAKLRTALETADSLAARSLWRQVAIDPLLWRHRIGGELNTLAASPTERRVAVAGNLSGIRLIDADTEAVTVLSGGTQMLELDFAPDGRALAGGDDSGHVWVWDLATLAPRDLGGTGRDVVALRFAPDGRTVHAVSQDGHLWRFDARGAAPTRMPTTALLGPTLAVAPDGRTLALVADGGDALLLDLGSGRETPLACPARPAMSTAFSADGAWIAAASRTAVCIWPTATAGATPPRVLDRAPAGNVAFSPDGKRLAVAGHDGALRIYDPATGALLQTFQEGDRVFARHPAWLPGGAAVGVVFVDGTVALFSTAPLPVEPPAPSVAPFFVRVAVSPDGAQIALAGSDGRVRLLDRDTGAERLVLKAHRGGAYHVAYAPDGRTLASLGTDGLVRLWDPATGRALKTLAGHTGVVFQGRFSGSGRALVSLASDGVRIWDVATGTQRAAFPVPDRTAAPDTAGDELVLGNRDGTIARYDVETGLLLERVAVAKDAIQGLAFADGGRVLALLTQGGDLLAREGGALRTLGQVECVPDMCTLIGDPRRPRLAIGQPSNRVSVWDLATGARITIESDAWASLAFTPDGGGLAGTGTEGDVALWDLGARRPRWRGPMLRADAGEAFTHAGWVDLAGQPRAVDDAPWRRAVAERAALAAEAGDTRCVATFDGAVEVWRPAGMVRVELPGVTALVAAADGCGAIAAGAASWIGLDGRATPLAKDAVGIAAGGGEIVVGAGERLLVVGPDGRREATVERGLTAVARTAGGDVVLGFEHGGLRRWRRGAPAADPPLRATPPSAVVQIADGPPDLIAAAFFDGSIGVWSAATGERLLGFWLRGPATHLAIAGQRLVALTGGGQLGVWDLETISMPYCDLLRGVWNQVPVVWDRGVAVVRPPPPGHVCATP